MLNRTKTYIWLFALLFVPYIILCFFAHPVADDYAYTLSSTFGGYWKHQVHDFLYWNGRYASNAVIILTPLKLHSFLGYRLVLLTLILLTPLTFYFFLSALFGKEFSKAQRFLGALALSVLYFGIMPDLAEGLYWQTGAITYQLGNMLTLTYIGIVALFLQKRFILNKSFHAVLCFLLLFISIGFNEVNTLILISIHIIVLFALRKEPSIRHTLLWLSILAILFSLIMILAPGNMARGNFFTNNYNILHSLKMTALQMIRFFLKWASFPPLLLASVLFIPIGQMLYEQSLIFRKMAEIKIWQGFTFLCLMIFLCVFPAYWGTGILGQHRTLNAACFFFVLIWFLFVFVLSKRFNLVQYTTTLPAKLNHFLTLLFIACLLISGNSGVALLELGSGEITSFNAEMNERYTILESAKQQGLKSVILPTLKDRPASLFVLDIKPGYDNLVNKTYAIYFGIDKVSTDSTTTIKPPIQ